MLLCCVVLCCFVFVSTYVVMYVCLHICVLVCPQPHGSGIGETNKREQDSGHEENVPSSGERGRSTFLYV